MIQLCQYRYQVEGPGVWPLKHDCNPYLFYRVGNIKLAVAGEHMIILQPLNGSRNSYSLVILKENGRKIVYSGYAIFVNEKYEVTDSDKMNVE